jgi:hypothetical protein
MKKIIVTSAVILGIIVFVSTGYCFKNEPDGFMGLKWGSKLEELKKQYKTVNRINKSANITWHVPGDGYTTFSGVRTYLTYQYYDDELYLVSIFFKTKEDGKKLEEALKVSYGEPGETYEDNTLWVGDKTHISIDYEKMLLVFYSKAAVSLEELPESE